MPFSRPKWNLPILHLDAAIVEQTSIRGVRGGLIDMGDPDDIVRDASPITIHGRTAGGESITLLRAHAQGPAVILVIIALAFVTAAACGYLVIALAVLFILAKPILVMVCIAGVHALTTRSQRKAK